MKNDLVSAALATPCTDVRDNKIGWRLLVENSRGSPALRRAVRATAKRCKVPVLAGTKRRAKKRRK